MTNKDQTYSVVDDFSELAMSPSGGLVALNPILSSGNQLLIVDTDSGASRLLEVANKRLTLVDLHFVSDDRILCVALDPEDLTRSALLDIKLADGIGTVVPLQVAFVRAPFMLGELLGFFGREAGGATLKGFVVRGAGEYEEITSAPEFQSVGCAFAVNGMICCDGRPGSDPFEALRIEQASRFSRAVLFGDVDATIARNIQGLIQRYDSVTVRGASNNAVYLTAVENGGRREFLVGEDVVTLGGPDFVPTGYAMASASGSRSYLTMTNDQVDWDERKVLVTKNKRLSIRELSDKSEFVRTDWR